jgi:pimeloyl-ACP methyl ester carboxylesterase
VSPLRSPDRCSRPAAYLAAASLALSLVGCQSLQPPPAGPLGPRLDGAIQVLASPQSSDRARTRAAADYRELAAAHLPDLLRDASERPLVPLGERVAGIQAPAAFAEIEPVTRPRLTRPELHRAGLGLPLMGHLAPDGPNAPRAGYRLPLTLVALPKGPTSACCEAAVADPRQVHSVRTARGDLPLAMDLETPLTATRVTGPRLGAGIANLLRPGHFVGRPRIVFLQPFDPDKTPVVLVHGLMSTPRMWEPLVLDLLTDPEIRARCQFWFFYYPTGQPVPLSALQLREALDDAAATHGLQRRLILVGHSMGGILSRAQVSRLTLKDAQTIVPNLASLPDGGLVRRALVFEPRTDVARAVFLFTPHRGSRLASSGLGSWGIRLIRLPDTLLSELGAVADQLTGPDRPRLPTSIHGLSPDSPFLGALDRTRPTVPTHTILGDRGRGDGLAGSDGVVPYLSAHLPSAESELVVPTGHGGFAHPQSVAEIKRIIRLALAEEDKLQARGASHDSLAQGRGTAGDPSGRPSRISQRQ